MRAKLGIVALLVPTIVAAAVIAGGTATGQEVVHVFLPSDSLQVQFLDFGRRGLRLGDRGVFRGALLDETRTNRVGTARGECIVQQTITRISGLWKCTYLLDLADGDITLEGLDPAGRGASAFAVTGGTGAYANAQGDATFTDSRSGTDMVIDLTP